MEPTGLISIIIPVYNVEKYLPECLESVIRQTHRSLEIICIDDGSTDRSGEICDHYAKKDERVIVIHQPNSGAGAARNAGLARATGDYIGFVDSDDYIAPEMYQTLYDALVSANGDIAACNTVEVFRNRKASCKESGSLYQWSGLELLRKTTEHWKYYIMVNKLFRRELVEGIVFPEGNVIDDGFYTYQIIARARTVVWKDMGLYFYRQRKSSVMNLEAFEGRRQREALRLQKAKLDFVKDHYPEVVGVFEKKMLDTYIEVICGKFLEKHEVRSSLRYMRKNCMEALFREYTVKESVWIIMFILFPETMKKRRGRNQPAGSGAIWDEFFD